MKFKSRLKSELPRAWCAHVPGYFDLYAYESYNNGTMTDTIPTDEQLQKSFAALPNIG